MTPSPQRPGGPGCLTEPLHHLGKQTSGRQPPDPTQGCWKWRGVGGSPVTEHALRLSGRDPAPCPSPSLCGPRLRTDAGFRGGEAWGWGALSRGVTVRRGQSRPPGPASSPERPAAPVGAGLNAEPSARAGVRWRSHARLCRPGKSGRSQGRPAPRPRRLALNGF